MNCKFEKWTFLAIILILLVGCAEDEDPVTAIEEEPEEQTPIQAYNNVDRELWIYYDRFEKEAAERGIQIDLRRERITGEISELHEDGVAGQCNYSSFFPNEIIVDKAFWDRANDRSREFVVFHELGHCSLGREHREASFSNGVCRSLMRSGTGNCIDNYRTSTRDTYLDELFDQRFFNEIN